MSRPTLFSWGYWGWGNVAPRLIEAVDAVEAARGFSPPVFVDIRISRSVRAVGFRDRAFEQLVGSGRYTWLKSLGNQGVLSRKGAAIQIARPEAASELIDMALGAASRGSRLLFFCACERPVNDAGAECHRVTVARLVRAAAAMRGVALETVEWPGGEPIELELAVPRATLRSVKQGRKTIPLDNDAPLARFAGLPWGSTVRITDGNDGQAILVSGPAIFTAGRWALPILHSVEKDGTLPAHWAESFRKRHGYRTMGIRMNT